MMITIDIAPEQRMTALVMTEQGRTSWKALFDALKEGDADEQRETLTLLKEAVDADRPGQRSVFGTGVNPDK